MEKAEKRDNNKKERKKEEVQLIYVFPTLKLNLRARFNFAVGTKW